MMCRTSVKSEFLKIPPILFSSHKAGCSSIYEVCVCMCVSKWQAEHCEANTAPFLYVSNLHSCSEGLHSYAPFAILLIWAITPLCHCSLQTARKEHSRLVLLYMTCKDTLDDFLIFPYLSQYAVYPTPFSKHQIWAEFQLPQIFYCIISPPKTLLRVTKLSWKMCYL